MEVEVEMFYHFKKLIHQCHNILVWIEMTYKEACIWYSFLETIEQFIILLLECKKFWWFTSFVVILAGAIHITAP